ncbi:hypothetical protein POM88_053811 [Heracleum sosnowskyi]|uniref:Two-component response regulator n=1 Tax=Heracleum sosnowskyi TaxID=360622 RepID=A0AAD8LXD8_9APIA|nr:hypothetical protein POM88_053811 [Heracleum sosnowskyi]
MVTILVVDDDRSCLAIVARLLNGCNYKVLTANNALDALCILRTRAIKFDLVVSDVHMPDLNGFELQRRIHEEFQLPVVLMSADKKANNLCEGSQSGASLFIVKPISTEDLKLIWEFGNQWKKKLAKGKNIISDYSYDNDNEDDDNDDDNEDDIGNKLYEKNSKRKVQIVDEDDKDVGKNIVIEGEPLVTKKKKVVWTPILHENFIKAVHHLGPGGSVPRNIHQVMNVPGLTRENVASHLQKYKIYLKKRREVENDPSMLTKLKNGKMWSSSFLSHEALLGYRQSSKLLTNPGFPPSGQSSGTYPSQLYQPQIQPSNCYIGSGQGVYNTFVSQSNFASPTFGTAFPEQQYESADLSNGFLYGSTYQSTDENNFGDAFRVNKDMPNADNVHLNLDEQESDEVNGAISGNNTTTNVEELVFWDENNPSENQNNEGMIVYSADNAETSNFNSKGNQPSNDDQQGQGLDEDFWASLLSSFP